MAVQQWVDAYAQAWRDRDADAAAALFTDDSLYRSHPLQEPHSGAAGVHAYWSDVTSTQDRVDVRMGRPVEASDGRRAAVEFWVRMLSQGAEVTLIGILFLRFADDGRCEELREAWHFEPGTRPTRGLGRLIHVVGIGRTTSRCAGVSVDRDGPVPFAPVGSVTGDDPA